MKRSLPASTPGSPHCPEPRLVVTALRCAVCAQPAQSGAPLLSCARCGVEVHAECYCAQPTSTDFTCQACQEPGDESPVCALCGIGSGALVRAATEGQWVHGVCATFVRGVYLRRDVERSILVADGVNDVLAKPHAFLGAQSGMCGAPGFDSPCATICSPSLPASRACEEMSQPARLQSSAWCGCPRSKFCMRPIKHSGKCKIDGIAQANALVHAGSTAKAGIPKKDVELVGSPGSREKSHRGLSYRDELTGIQNSRAMGANNAARDTICTASPSATASSSEACTLPSGPATCVICHGSPFGGFVRCAAEGCDSLVHPQCCLREGLVLVSVAHFGADLNYALCPRHSTTGWSRHIPTSTINGEPQDGTRIDPGNSDQMLMHGRPSEVETCTSSAKTLIGSRNPLALVAHGQVEVTQMNPVLTLMLRRCYFDEGHLEYCATHESRDTKLARLLESRCAAKPRPDSEPLTAESGHTGHLAPAQYPYHYDIGTERTGADGRTWRVVSEGNARWRWAALDAQGRTTGLVARVHKFVKTGGLKRKSRKIDVGTRVKAQIKKLGTGEGKGCELGVPWKGPSDGCAELDADDVNEKLWPGAAAEGWRMFEKFRGGASSSNFKYVAPWGLYFSNRAHTVLAKNLHRTSQQNANLME